MSGGRLCKHTHNNLFIIQNRLLIGCSLINLTGYSFGTPQADQYAPQVPPPPTTPGSAPLGFAPATTPTQDLSKAPTGQPDFPYSQYGKRSILQCVAVFFLPFSFNFTVAPTHLLWHFNGCNDDLFRWTCTYHLACKAAHAYMLLAYVKPCDTAMNMVLKFTFIGVFFLYLTFFSIEYHYWCMVVFGLDHPSL